MDGFVFDLFKKNLGLGKVDWNGRFDIFLTDICPPYLQHIKDPEQLNEYLGRRLGQVQGLSFETVNSITKAKSENYYEAIEAYPASAYLFSDECPNTYFKLDWDYKSYSDTHYNTSTYCKQNDEFNAEYWERSYNLSNTYSEGEYQMYGIPLNTVSEDVVKLTNNSINYKDWDSYQGHYPGGNGAIVYYKGKSQASSFPVFYIQFDSYHDGKYGPMTIEWIGKMMELQ